MVKPHIFLVLIYRPPDASLSNFFNITNRIETTLLQNNASANDILLMGDFNLTHIKWDNGHASNNATAHGRILLAIAELFYLEQIVDKPTRVNNILDLVFCPHTVSNGCNILPTGISDHNIITIIMNITLTSSSSLPHNKCSNMLRARRHWTITKQTSVNLTLSDPGYFRQLTIRGGGSFKSPPPL